MTWIYHATPEVERISTYPTIISVTGFHLDHVDGGRNKSHLSKKTVGMGRQCSVFDRSAFVFLPHSFSLLILLFAQTISLAYTIMAIVQTRYGLGLPPDLHPKQTLHRFLIVSASVQN